MTGLRNLQNKQTFYFYSFTYKNEPDESTFYDIDDKTGIFVKNTSLLLLTVTHI